MAKNIKPFLLSAAAWTILCGAVMLTVTAKEKQIAPPIVVDTELLASVSDQFSGCEDDIYPEDYENELIESALLSQANRLDEVTITYYCRELYPHICGGGKGITATGETASNVTCAVDPDVIPLGSQVMVDFGDGNIEYFIAQDTGSAIKRNHIDICVATHKQALQMGKRTATVYWIED